jgi:hypothetical protein
MVSDFIKDAQLRAMRDLTDVQTRHAIATENLEAFMHVRPPTVEEALTYILRDSPFVGAFLGALEYGEPPNMPPRDKPLPEAASAGVASLLELALILQMLLACSDCDKPILCPADVLVRVTFESGNVLLFGVGGNQDTGAAVRMMHAAAADLRAPEPEPEVVPDAPEHDLLADPVAPDWYIPDPPEIEPLDVPETKDKP